MEAHRESVKWTTWVKEIGLAVVVVVIAIFVLRVVARAFRWTRSWLIDQNGKRIKGLGDP